MQGRKPSNHSFERPRVFVAALLLLACVTTVNAYGQESSPEPSVVPRLVSFSGVVKDSAGKVVTGSTSLIFSLYALQDGGRPLWVETQTVQADEQGHYTVLLGANSPDGLPLDVFKSGSARWLGITPALPGTGELPRVLLVGVPYALKAADADTLGGRPASAYVTTEANNLSSGSAATSQKTTSADSPSGSSASSAASNVSGSGKTNYIPIWANNTTLTSSTIFEKSGQVGIGTTTPASILDIDGDLTTRVASGSEAGDVEFLTGHVGNGAGYLELWTDNGTNGKTHIGSWAGDVTYFQSFGGKVGIGTTNPAATLEVNGTAKFDQAVTFAPSQTFPGLATLGSNNFVGTETVTGAVVATSSGAAGVFGSTTEGVVGLTGTGGSGSSGAYGGIGVSGTGGNDTGSCCSSAGGQGVVGQGGNGEEYGGPGVAGAGGAGSASNGVGGDGVQGFPGSGPVRAGYAGNFSGSVNVTGTLYASTKDFKIDHPLDPANKYLYHSSVESSEMMNIYTGNVVTDASGEAMVDLPEWFEALNRDFRYQLTVIGQFAQATVSSEIADHRFGIKTDKPGVKVSWEVTAVRQDAYAKAHPLQVEAEKPEEERGYYIHPELYGAPEEKQIEWARHPEMMKRIRETRERSQASGQSGSAQ